MGAVRADARLRLPEHDRWAGRHGDRVSPYERPAAGHAPGLLPAQRAPERPGAGRERRAPGRAEGPQPAAMARCRAHAAAGRSRLAERASHARSAPSRRPRGLPLLREVAPGSAEKPPRRRGRQEKKGGPSRHSPSYSPGFLAPLAPWRFASQGDLPRSCYPLILFPPHLHRAGLVRRLPGVLVEGRERQLVRDLVVHRDEDLPGLHRVRDERPRLDLRAAETR